MKILLGIIVIFIAGYIGAKCQESLHKDYTKKAIEEYEKEKQAREKSRE